MNEEKFWRAIERFKTLVELAAATIIVAPVLFALIQQGLMAVLPVWLVLLIIIFAIFLGYVLGRGKIISRPTIQAGPGGATLQKIVFDYQDPPTYHGWTIWQSQEKAQPPTFRHVSDGYFGNALEIRATDTYAMDWTVNPLAQSGRKVEFVVKAEQGFGLFARVIVQSRDGSKSEEVWLNFKIGSELPYPYEDGRKEWKIPMTPNQVDGDWLSFLIDLNEAVSQTFGKRGWSFKKVTGFRLSGNLTVAYISVLG